MKDIQRDTFTTGAAQGIQGLIREVNSRLWELEQAHALAYERIRSLSIDTRTINILLFKGGKE